MKADSPITNKTSTEKKVAAVKAASDAVTAADVKKAIAAPKVDAPKRGPKKAAAQNEETAASGAAQGKTEEASAPKKRGRKPGAKNASSKKETVKKTAAKKTSKAVSAKKESETAAKGAAKKMEEQIVIQFAGKECTKDDLMNRINEIWTSEYGKKVSEMKKAAFYVKTEESAVYYVINDDITGKFDI